MVDLEIINMESTKRKRDDEEGAADAENGASGASGMAIESPVTVTAAPAAPAVAPVAAEAAEALPGGELAALLEELSAVTPTIPTAAIHFYLMKNGFNTTDERVIKMVAMATQKFVADVATDALQHCKQRQAGIPASRRATAKDKRFVLTSADLQAALKEQGIGIAKPPYYV